MSRFVDSSDFTATIHVLTADLGGGNDLTYLGMVVQVNSCKKYLVNVICCTVYFVMGGCTPEMMSTWCRAKTTAYSGIDYNSGVSNNNHAMRCDYAARMTSRQTHATNTLRFDLFEL
jgi:hypothetical protein